MAAENKLSKQVSVLWWQTFLQEQTCRPCSAWQKLCICCWFISCLLLYFEDMLTFFLPKEQTKRLYYVHPTVLKFLGFGWNREISE